MQGIDRIRSWHGELVRVPWQRQLTTWPDEVGTCKLQLEKCAAMQRRQKVVDPTHQNVSARAN